jgi:hypothetical protein
VRGPVLDPAFAINSARRAMINSAPVSLGAFPRKGAFKPGPEPIIMLLAGAFRVDIRPHAIKAAGRMDQYHGRKDHVSRLVHRSRDPF